MTTTGIAASSADTADEAESLLVQALLASGASDGLVYVMSTETRGPRELELMIELDTDRHALAHEHRELRWARVIVPNAADTEVAVQRARRLWPTLLVPNLNGLDVKSWDAHRYRAFRARVTEAYAARFVTGPNWAWSMNERRGVQWARTRGIPIHGLTGREVSDDELASEIQEVDGLARTRLAEANWTEERIERALAG